MQFALRSPVSNKNKGLKWKTLRQSSVKALSVPVKTGENASLRNTEEKWWHIGSHAEFGRTELFTKAGNLAWSRLPAANASISQEVHHRNPRRVSGRDYLAENRDVSCFSRFTPETYAPQFILPHWICLLWIKFEISSPDMWHFTLCSLSMPAHLFWGSLAPASDSSWKFSGWTGHQCTLISAELQVEARIKCPAHCFASVLTKSAVITGFTSLQGPPWFLPVPSSPSYCWDKIPWLVCVFWAVQAPV